MTNTEQIAAMAERIEKLEDALRNARFDLDVVAKSRNASFYVRTFAESAAAHIGRILSPETPNE